MAIKVVDKKWCAYTEDYVFEYLCDTDNDFANLPQCPAGSQALSVATGTIKVVNASGQWVTFGG